VTSPRDWRDFNEIQKRGFPTGLESESRCGRALSFTDIPETPEKSCLFAEKGGGHMLCFLKCPSMDIQASRPPFSRTFTLKPARLALCAGLAALAFAPRASAADPAVLLKDPEVQAAFEAIKRNEPETIETQIRLTEIPAPSFKEQAKAAAVKEIFEKYGLHNVFIDKEGNVLGTHQGAKAHPHVVIAAHLDTVFPEGTDVKVKRDGAILRAPGIGDDTRGLAELVSLIRVFKEQNLKTEGMITFVANVGEEGLGDLRGVKRVFNETLKDQVDMFISIDGGSIDNVTNAAVGSYRYRVTFKGPGGHSYGAFGLVNPIHALGRAAAKIADIQVPTSPKTTFNIGRIGGGTSVNSIPFEAWMEIDMRSPDISSIDKVRSEVLAAVDSSVVEENKRWGKGTIVADVKQVGDRPAGTTSRDTTLVKTVDATIRALGRTPSYGASSTDSNYPIKLGIPAITIGRGGISRDAHALSENFDTTDSWKGPQFSLLLLLSLTR
jgi:tripeptide aminopeptidase